MSRTVARKKTEYRSALRSRKLIKQAYVELIKEKDMDKISVIDVVTRADINRGTFYAHYKSVIDVADQISDEILSALLEFLNEFDNTRLIENPLPFLTNIARFLEKDLEYYRKNAEEDYLTTPISVLRYITEMEQALRIHDVSNRRELLCAFFKYFRDNGEANIGMTIEEFVDGFLSTQ